MSNTDIYLIFLLQEIIDSGEFLEEFLEKIVFRKAQKSSVVVQFHVSLQFSCNW